MEIFLKYLNLYIINKITLNSNLIKLDTNKKYVIIIFKNNKFKKMFINYKFNRTINKNYYKFNNNHHWYNFDINKHDIKIDILELADDFNYTHLEDILSTHYDKINVHDTHNNGIYLNSENCIIYECQNSDIKQNYLLKSLINNNINLQNYA